MPLFRRVLIATIAIFTFHTISIFFLTTYFWLNVSRRTFENVDLEKPLPAQFHSERGYTFNWTEKHHICFVNVQPFLQHGGSLTLEPISPESRPKQQDVVLYNSTWASAVMAPAATPVQVHWSNDVGAPMPTLDLPTKLVTIYTRRTKTVTSYRYSPTKTTRDSGRADLEIVLRF